VLNLVFYLLFWHLTWVTLCLWSMYDWPTYTVSIQAVISLSLSLSPSPITLSLSLSITLCTHLPWIFRNQSQRSMLSDLGSSIYSTHNSPLHFLLS
jgi:hypothetical protein